MPIARPSRHRQATPSTRGRPMSNRSGILPCALLALAVACGGDSTGPGDPAAGPRIEIAPGALLLTAAGGTEALHVRAFDADGHEMTAPSVTWRSSDQAVVTVGSDGLATAIAGAGSAHIIADAGDLVSPPILVVIAQPAEGAVLVADSQVVGTLEPVSETAAYQPGWQYRVHLTGITPVPGQILLASGGAPVAGRVVSATPGTSGESIVTLELLPLNQLFRTLSVNETLPLTAIVPRVSDAAASFYRATTTRSGTTLTRRGTGPVFATASSRAETEFELGPFECKAESGIEVASFSLDPGPLTITPTLSLDLVLDAATGLRRLVAHGSITARQLLKPRLTGTATGKVDCNATPLSIPFPVSGPLGFFVSGALPVGAGFELGTEITTGTIGADLDLAAAATIAVGVACDAGCHPVADLSANTDGTSARPVLPSIGNSFRAKFTGSEYAYAKFAVGNAFIQSLQIGLLEAKLGITQEFDLASKEYQAADPAYASSFLLKPLVSAGTTLNITQGAAMLGIEIPPLTFEPEFNPSAQSPHGTFSITPASVHPGSGSALGDQATFNVHLDPVSYLGAYSVESVEIRWVRAGTSGTGITLDPGRPGCTTLAAAQDQADFSCTTDFTASQTGEQTFYAFVHSRIFGVPIAAPLELAADGKATVVVGEGGVTVSPSSATVAPGGTRQFTATIAGGGDQSVTWSATGGTISNSGLYTAAQATGQFTVTATSVANPSATGSAQVTISTSFIPGATYVGTRLFQGSPSTENPTALIFNTTNTQMIQCTIPSAGNQPNTYREACATAGAPFTNQSGYFVANVTVSGGSVTGTIVDVTGTFTGTIEASRLTGRASFSGGLFNTYDTTRR